MSYINENEGAYRNYRFECIIEPINYMKLINIAREEDIRTLDISTVINYVIEHYPRKNTQNLP